MAALTSRPAGRTAGDVRVPGDKSISHRALMVAAMTVGDCFVSGLLEGDDVMRTAAALAALGVGVGREPDGRWRVRGVGVGGLAEPAEVLDLGNSGTGARLLMGLLATHPFDSFLTGDRSLRRRPMARILEPVRRMGADAVARSGDRLPLVVLGAADPVPIVYRSPVASAQVKSAVLLAGLNAPGATTVVEPQPTRDHTERMLRHVGAELRIGRDADGARTVAVAGYPELAACDLEVPGDVSSAAFPGVAALLLPGSEVTLRRVGLNPLRAGLIETLREMAADVSVADRGEAAGEPVADLTFRAGDRVRLRAVDVPAARAPSMIDEYPILAVAAACAEGTTRMRGLAELRVKESDRLAAIVAGLRACGVAAAIEGDTLIVQGDGRPPKGGAGVATAFDHRIAMSFLVLGMAAAEPVTVDDDGAIGTSFPGFVALMNGLGADIAAAGDDAR